MEDTQIIVLAHHVQSGRNVYFRNDDDDYTRVSGVSYYDDPDGTGIKEPVAHLLKSGHVDLYNTDAKSFVFISNIFNYKGA